MAGHEAAVLAWTGSRRCWWRTRGTGCSLAQPAAPLPVPDAVALSEPPPSRSRPTASCTSTASTTAPAATTRTCRCGPSPERATRAPPPASRASACGRPCPPVFGAKTAAVEADFFGGFPTIGTGENFGHVRLRLANARLDWTKTSLVLGQDWMVFAPVNPSSLACAAIPLFAAGGNPWASLPQVRVDGASARLLQAAVLAPQSGDFSSTFLAQPNRARSPNSPYFQGRVAITSKEWHRLEQARRPSACPGTTASPGSSGRHARPRTSTRRPRARLVPARSAKHVLARGRGVPGREPRRLPGRHLPGHQPRRGVGGGRGSAAGIATQGGLGAARDQSFRMEAFLRAPTASTIRTTTTSSATPQLAYAQPGGRTLPPVPGLGPAFPGCGVSLPGDRFPGLPGPQKDRHFNLAAVMAF